MKSFPKMGKKKFDNGPFSIINKELKKAGHLPVGPGAEGSAQTTLQGSNPGRKAKM